MQILDFDLNKSGQACWIWFNTYYISDNLLQVVLFLSENYYR